MAGSRSFRVGESATRGASGEQITSGDLASLDDVAQENAVPFIARPR